MQKLLQKFLKTHKYYSQQKDFDEYFLSHPNYPSLYAVTDTLSLVGIENVAAKIPLDQFFELPDSFLSIHDNKLVLIEKSTEVVIITKEDGTTEKLLFNDFLNKWDGVVVAIGENEAENQTKGKSYFKEIVFLTLSLFFATSVIINDNFSFAALIGFALLTGGLFVSILIIEEKYNDGTEDGLTSKICTFTESMSCNNVIKSKQAQLLKSVDFSDLPILFFGTAVIGIILNASITSTIGLLCLLTLPTIVYSIWLQKAVLQKWCLLCLLVSTIIIFASFLSIPFLANPNWNGFLFLFSILSIVSFVWFSYRNLLKTNTDLIKNNRQLLNFKRNPAVYNFLKKPVQFKEAFHSIQTIDYGAAVNPVHLTLILSPSCGHCHKAYEEALELISNYSDKFKLSIFFNVNPENYDNKYLKIVFNLMQIRSKQPMEMTREALHDWHIKRFSLEQWMKKWDQGNIEESVLKELQFQYNWCLESNLNYTPVKIVNDSLFPQEYTISELRYFIPQLEEELETA